MGTSPADRNGQTRQAAESPQNSKGEVKQEPVASPKDFRERDSSIKGDKQERYRKTSPSFFAAQEKGKKESEEDKEIPLMELRHSKQVKAELQRVDEEGEEREKNGNLFLKEMQLETSHNKFDDFEESWNEIH